MGSLHLGTGFLVVGSIISQKAPSRANHTQVGWHRTNQSSYTLALWPSNLEVKGFSYYSKLEAHQPSSPPRQPIPSGTLVYLYGKTALCWPSRKANLSKFTSTLVVLDHPSAVTL